MCPACRTTRAPCFARLERTSSGVAPLSCRGQIRHTPKHLGARPEPLLSRWWRLRPVEEEAGKGAGERLCVKLAVFIEPEDRPVQQIKEAYSHELPCELLPQFPPRLPLPTSPPNQILHFSPP